MRYFIKKEYLRKLHQFGFVNVGKTFNSFIYCDEVIAFVDKKTGEYKVRRFEDTQVVMPFTGELADAITTVEVSDEPKLPKHMWEAKE